MNRVFSTIGLLYVCVYMFFNFAAIAVNAEVIEDKNDFENVWTIVSYNNFRSSYGDYFLVDIENGKGFLINDSTQIFTMFPLITGAKRTPTPEKDWVIKEKKIQSNRVIFGESGEFLRMFENGEKRTSYGVHGYKYFEKEIEAGRKFLSLGCVLVADDVLDRIEGSYWANGEYLNISTKNQLNLLEYLSKGSSKEVRFKYKLI